MPPLQVGFSDDYASVAISFDSAEDMTFYYGYEAGPDGDDAFVARWSGADFELSREEIEAAVDRPRSLDTPSDYLVAGIALFWSSVINAPASY